MRPSRAARLRCCFPCDWALRRRLSRTDHALSPSAWMRVSTRPSRSRPQWTRKRRTHGAQSDARSRQRMQKCTPRGRRSRGSSISGVYRARPMETLPPTQTRSGAIAYVTYQLRARTRSVHWRHIHGASRQGPPRVHERGNTRRHPATRRPPEPVVLQGFLSLLSPPVRALHTAVHDS
jgi:hypothetical protein